jgi:hypothetical protein
LRNRYHRLAAILIAAGICSGVLGAKTKKAAAAPPQDQITVEAHIGLTSGPVTGFVTTQHYSSTWVYAEHEDGKGATILDVSRPAHPKIVSEISSGTLLSVNGTTALSIGGPSDSPQSDSPLADAPKAGAPKTIRLMDFSDPEHPKVTRQFDGVTAVQPVGRGLILLANPEGVWILSEHLADDPAVDERYARKVLYGESMY